jgi:ubiquinone/menaquinone biosynthesis C-methylase UbiE
VLAFDPDEDAIDAARAATPRSLKRRMRFEVADATEIELPEREFDLALFSWSL